MLEIDFGVCALFLLVGEFSYVTNVFAGLFC